MKIRGAGGTDGGLGSFFMGLVLAGVGMYLFLSRVSIASNMSSIWGGHLGLVLLPLALGLALLFFSGRSIIGWVLTLGSVAVVFVGIVMNLTAFFRPTDFFQTVAMITCLFIGLILMARSLRSVAA